jgi:anti-sigma factor RsiW
MSLPRNPPLNFCEAAMTRDPDTQTEMDILAFVNGQLDGERRYAVMEYLSHHPDRAAEVMADLRLTEGLRLAVATVETPPPPALRLAAEHLSAAVSQQTIRRRWLPFVAGLAFFALGWGAQGLMQGDRIGAETASVLDAAMDAQDSVMLRASLSGELGPISNDPERIAARLGIDLPDMPQGWTIRAAQVVATPERPGIAVMVDTPDMGEILLFGVLRSADDPDEPAIATSRNGRALAYFERERTAFVLVDASGTPGALGASAEALRNRFN